jgi:hypothetical protein
MEPVRLPKMMGPVMHADRVKRAKSRENGDEGGAFKRYLRQNRDRPAEASEESVSPANAIDPEEPEDGGGHAPQKRIDVRV